MEDTKNDRTFRNIVIFSIGFLLLMAAWLPTAAISQSIIQSAKVDDPSVTVNGFLALSIVNGAFAVSNFFAPAILNLIGVKSVLIIGSALYAPFIVSFIYPKAWLVYLSAALLGFAAANVWVGNGCYFAITCTKDNIQKYLGINWSIMALGQLFGSVFVYFKFQGSNHIDYDTRLFVVAVFTVICIAASITLIFPEYSKKKSEKEIEAENISETEQPSLYENLIAPFRLLGNKHMLLLIPPSFMNGLEISMFSSLFPTTVGFTEAFGDDARKYVGVAGILIGVGSLTGGLVLGVFGEKTVKSSRSLCMLIGCISYVIACFLTYINHPNSASRGPTQDTSWINPPLVPVSMVSAFLFGFGDGALSPQMTGAIGVIWPDHPSPALAMYRFFQAGFCSFGFFLGTITGLYNYLLIFSGCCICGTGSFYWNEVLIARKLRNESNEGVSQIQIIAKKMSYTLSEKDLNSNGKEN